MFKMHQIVLVGIKKWRMKKRKLDQFSDMQTCPKGRHFYFSENFRKEMRNLLQVTDRIMSQTWPQPRLVCLMNEPAIHGSIIFIAAYAELFLEDLHMLQCTNALIQTSTSLGSSPFITCCTISPWQNSLRHCWQLGDKTSNFKPIVILWRSYQKKFKF